MRRFHAHALRAFLVLMRLVNGSKVSPLTLADVHSLPLSKFRTVHLQSTILGPYFSSGFSTVLWSLLVSIYDGQLCPPYFSTSPIVALAFALNVDVRSML